MAGPLHYNQQLQIPVQWIIMRNSKNFRTSRSFFSIPNHLCINSKIKDSQLITYDLFNIFSLSSKLNYILHK